MKRCDWCGDDFLCVSYHDEEWGVPEYDSQALWEKLVLDSFQAGLSWLTILRKREAFRAAFSGFNPDLVAMYDVTDVQRLLSNAAIVRHRGKIETAIKGARAWRVIENEQGFANYLWGFVDGRPICNTWSLISEVPTKTNLSVAISKDLKHRGFSFCGPIIVYAFMQACGLVNDHLISCPRYKIVQKIAR